MISGQRTLTQSKSQGSIAQTEQRKGWLPTGFHEKQLESVEEAKRRDQEAYFAALSEAFPFHAYIDATEQRGITLSQLRTVLGFAKRHCFRWHDTAPPNYSHTSGLALHTGILNLYHVNTWLIKPSTKAANCAFVELLADREQPPFFFLSHWWGEVVEDFVQCVECHARARRLLENTSFWVCAYANRQHDLQGDISDDPKQTSFFKAMQLAGFRVLLILDAKTVHTGPATPFSRAWCAFEESMCLDHSAAPLDVATRHRSGVELITRGLTADEEALESVEPGAGFRAKAARESTFPLDAIVEGLRFDIRNAQASVEVDRTHILNCICGRTLELPPAADHAKYHEANARLRALFALAVWRRVMASSAASPRPASVASGASTGAHERALLAELRSKFPDVLRGDTWRTALELSLAGFDDTAGDTEAVSLAQSLPPNLREVKVDLRGIGISDACMGPLAGGLPPKLRAAEIDLSGCAKITNDGVVEFQRGLRAIGQLSSFCLRLRDTSVTEGWQRACETLEGFRSLARESDGDEY